MLKAASLWMLILFPVSVFATDDQNSIMKLVELTGTHPNWQITFHKVGTTCTLSGNKDHEPEKKLDQQEAEECQSLSESTKKISQNWTALKKVKPEATIRGPSYEIQYRGETIAVPFETPEECTMSASGTFENCQKHELSSAQEFLLSIRQVALNQNWIGKRARK